jgi:hypothetical protein
MDALKKKLILHMIKIEIALVKAVGMFTKIEELKTTSKQ